MYNTDKMDAQQYQAKLQDIKKHRGIGALIQRVQSKLIEPRHERTIKRWIAKTRGTEEVDLLIDEAATEVLNEFRSREAAAA